MNNVNIILVVRRIVCNYWLLIVILPRLLLMVLPSMVRTRIYIVGIFGALIGLFGTIFLFTWPSLFKLILYGQMQVTQGSKTFALWRDTPVPMYMNFYFHNWTNPDKLNVEKPRFIQMGPYRFNLEERKANIVINNNGTVTFKIARKWYFDQEKSNGTLDDIVTTLNAVALSAAKTSKDWSVFLTAPLSVTIRQTGQKIFIQKSVGELLFFGYEDPLMDIAGKLPSIVGVDLPFDKFAWFYGRNESTDFEGTFNMDTGENDIFQLGKLHNWNYGNRTGFYNGHCADVYGSAGELFPPKQTRDNGIQFFSPDLCRSLTLSYNKDVEVHGIKGYRYVGDQCTFDNGTLNSENECFCNGQCSPSGVLNVTTCRFGAPGFVSFPHFHLADRFYLEQIDGMEPDANLHTLYITLEPETGIPLDVAARFQINLLLSPVQKIALFKDVPTIYFPMIWFEQRAGITEGLAWQVKLVLVVPLIGQILALLIIFSGFTTLIYSLFIIITRNRSKKILARDEPVIKPLMQNDKQIIPLQNLSQNVG